MGKLMVRILDVSWASRCWPMLEILPELMGQLMSVQTCFSRAVFRAILSRCLHTPRHLQGVWDPFPQMESMEQSCPDVCTLPDTSRECGTPSPRQNLQSNLIWMSACYEIWTCFSLITLFHFISITCHPLDSYRLWTAD